MNVYPGTPGHQAHLISSLPFPWTAGNAEEVLEVLGAPFGPMCVSGRLQLCQPHPHSLGRQGGAELGQQPAHFWGDSQLKVGKDLGCRKQKALKGSFV